MSPDQVVILTVLVLVVAFLYSSVGHAGASGYIAVMSLIGLAPAVIKPTALVVWLLLRILVLSIDQKYFWLALIFVPAVFVFRILSHARETVQPEVYLESNATLDNIEYWRVRFAGNSHNIWDEKTLKRDLLHLLVSCYTSNQNTSNNFDIYQAMEQGEVSLPEYVRDFLFSQEPREPDRSRQMRLQSRHPPHLKQRSA